MEMEIKIVYDWIHEDDIDVKAIHEYDLKTYARYEIFDSLSKGRVTGELEKTIDGHKYSAIWAKIEKRITSL